MRRELAIAVASSLLALVSSRAHAETRVLVGADSYVATAPGVTIADVAWSAHVEWRDAGGDGAGESDAGARIGGVDAGRAIREIVVDWVQREPLLDGTPRRELHELAYTDRSVGSIAITIGRFRVPGGFWLMTDGLGVSRQLGGVTLGAYAGSRSFTNSRDDMLLASTPHFLPLAGAALETRGDDVQAQLAYTYTFDRITLYRGDGMAATSQQPEQFVDGQLVAALGKRVLLAGGANVGSRYLVAYSASSIAADPRVANVWFGSQAVYAQLDARAGGWRVSTTLAALRTKLGQQSDEAARSVDDPEALAAISGSFVEGTLRAAWRRDKAWRIDGRYRVRGFADGRQVHRALLAAEWQRDELDVQASVGCDVHRNSSEGYTDSRSLLYKASIGRKSQRAELLIGAAAVSALGDEVSLTAGEPSDHRAPYTLEARSYGFVRGFATRGNWFAGIDAEYDLDGDGKRVLAQIGYGR